MALTAKKKAFAQAKHDGANNKEAAIFAGCSPETASQAGSRMAKDPDVIAHLERLTSVKDINTLNLYVKPEENSVYYVVNETVSGKLTLPELEEA